MNSSLLCFNSDIELLFLFNPVSKRWLSDVRLENCDWLRAFQNVGPAGGSGLVIGFLSSSSEALGHFRLHDGVVTKREKENRKIPPLAIAVET